VQKFNSTAKNTHKFGRKRYYHILPCKLDRKIKFAVRNDQKNITAQYKLTGGLATSFVVVSKPIGVCIWHGSAIRQRFVPNPDIEIPTISIPAEMANSVGGHAAGTLGDVK